MQLALWAGDPEDAWRRFGALLDTRDDEISPGTVGDLLALAARAAGDMAHLSPGSAGADRHDLHGSLHTLRSRLHHDPYSPSAVPSDRAAEPQWSAELERIRGSDGLESWLSAARSWDHVGRPHDAAYCRWRARRSPSAKAKGTVAARLLKRAAPTPASTSRSASRLLRPGQRTLIDERMDPGSDEQGSVRVGAGQGQGPGAPRGARSRFSARRPGSPSGCGSRCPRAGPCAPGSWAFRTRRRSRSGCPTCGPAPVPCCPASGPCHRCSGPVARPRCRRRRMPRTRWP